jgi:hypothetical protein
VIFSDDRKSYSLAVKAPISTIGMNKGLWLVLAGVNEIPPHIALIQDGKYYSISARKVKVGEPIEKFLKAISRNSLPTLFISIAFHQTGGLRGAEEFFNSYPVLGNGDHSCLSPVSDFFAKNYSSEFSNTLLVFELLALAQEQDLLLECKGMYIPLLEEAEGKTVRLTLPKYTHEHIREKINSILSK